MKICFFSGDITRSGGTERVASIIVNELIKSGMKICILSLVEQKDKTFYHLDKRIERYSLGTKWINPGPGYIPLIFKLNAFLKKNNIDIIVDIDTVLDVLSVPAASKLKTKVISWEHFSYSFEMDVFYRKQIVKHFVKRSDYLITLTQGDANSFLKEFKNKKKVKAIYNPVILPEVQNIKSDNEYKNDGKNDNKNHDIIYSKKNKENKWILSAGNLIKRKGTDYLIQTAEMVLNKYQDWTWHILGDGEEEENLKRQIKEKNLSDKLIMHGRVNNVGEFLKKSDIFVLTSRKEGLPMCLLEAKAYKVPSVSFDIETGPNEIILDGINGFLIEPFDCDKMAEKIGVLIENKDMRNLFSDRSLENITKFQLDSIINEWKNLFMEVING